ncbi:DUF3892 domain-containing protein [Metabacillus indicus]|uniref:DUF3892 domain-containing protein n=1 Tax=Metabacillus indicus TaxID=246786 RepID=UPI00068FF83F|nr:DUF3892 domain-containing protein [Metabacillus indicus]
MNEFLTGDPAPLSDLFDADFSHSQNTSLLVGSEGPAFVGHTVSDLVNIQDFFQHEDPLKQAFKMSYDPFHFHTVEPHLVKGYFRQDGTYVEGYFRDGDGNTAVNLTGESGGGYIRSNPDGVKWNNLNGG